MMHAHANNRVLLVEDSEDDALVVRRAFQRRKLPHELVVVSTGEAALEYLQHGKPQPALMLLDLNLPGLSGLEVLRRLRQDGRLMPVTILSASARDADVTEAYRLGANHYLVKPLEFEEFANLLQRWSDYWLSGRLPR